MLKKMFLSTVLVTLLGAEQFSLNLKRDSWNLVGTPIDLSIKMLDLGDEDIAWYYKNGYWYLNKDTRVYPRLETIEANSGFWVYSTEDKNITLEYNTTNNITIANNWSMVSPSSNMVVDQVFNHEKIGIVWKYKDNNWSAWDKDGIYEQNNISKAENLNLGEGAWVYATEELILDTSPPSVTIGDSTSLLRDGTFQTITKSSSDDIENIWNISFDVNIIDLSDFSIGIKFVKESSGAIGEIVFTGLNIIGGVIDNPDYVIIKGIKSDGTSGQTYFYDSYNPDDILSNSVTLVGDKLTLKLGTIMQKQSVTSEATFRAISDYTLQINSDKLEIYNSKQISLGNLTDFNLPDKFDNKNGIEGTIEIK